LAWFEVEGLEAFYHRVPVLHGVGLELDEGDFVSVIGSNGAGKTTLLRSISGLIQIKGRIALDGRDVAGLSPRECVKRRIIHCPEGRLLFPNMSVQQNLMMGAFLRHDAPEIGRDLARVFHYLPVLESRQRQMAGTLSGGEQQMLALGRGLMGGPRLLLLDEPSLGLAPRLVDEVFGVIERIRRDGMTILLVEQNAAVALEVADYGYVLAGGRIVLHGPGRDLLEDERVRDAYLGEAETVW